MLELINVHKKLGEFSLRGINLSIKENEYFVILGPTGTGKTVILELISGMYTPDSGQIKFNGIDITKLDPADRQIGYVAQDYLLFPHLDVKANILFGLNAKKIPKAVKEQKLQEIVNLLDLKHLLHRDPSTMSGGEQQRVAIARTLITNPKILLLDEPLGALDPRTQEIFQQELKKLHEKIKTTTIHITHNFSEAIILADRIAVVHNGKIVQVGTPDEIFTKPRSCLVAHFTGMENIFSGEIQELNDSKMFISSKVRFHVVTKATGRVYAAIRPEDIIISKDTINSSARNVLKGKIVEIIPQGALVKIRIDIGIPLTALITRQSCEDLKLASGQTVYTVFKSTSVHVFN
jgi:molybdate/tungstate transport system ATP-binding protein